MSLPGLPGPDLPYPVPVAGHLAVQPGVVLHSALVPHRHHSHHCPNSRGGVLVNQSSSTVSTAEVTTALGCSSTENIRTWTGLSRINLIEVQTHLFPLQ